MIPSYYDFRQKKSTVLIPLYKDNQNYVRSIQEWITDRCRILVQFGFIRHLATVNILLLSAVSTVVWAAADSGDDYVQGQRWALNMPTGVTNLSQEIFGLHMLILWVCVAIGVVVFGAMLISMYFHRQSRNHEAANFHEHFGLEVFWTTAAFLILVVLAWPATLTTIDIYDSENAEVDILITGYQWKWKYDYIDSDVSFFSTLRTPKEEIYNEVPKGEFYLLDVDEPLVIPVKTKVRFLITASDVLHSWWVPDFAVKRDAIPGFINETWAIVEREGVYRGQCAELCGKDHGFMPITVNVVSTEEYQQWLTTKRDEAARERELRDKTFTMEQQMVRGEEIYQRNCSSCHLANGAGIPGAFPGLLQGSVATGSIREHLDVVVNGSPGTAMAAFGAQLSEVDLAAVITYERNAWGNNTEDLVQPIDIVEFQSGQ